MKNGQIQRRASTLILTMVCLALLTFTAAYTLRRVRPRFEMASQFAAWQEARLAAESGIDVALVELERNAVGTQDGPWAGWKQDKSPPAGNAAGAGGGLLGGLTGLLSSLLSGTLSRTNSVLSTIGNSVTVSSPIYLDNLQVVSPGNRPTNVDVQLWAVYPTPSPYYRWFRLRAMATCAIPPVATSAAPDRLDNSLRRYSLREIRPQLRKDDVGSPMTVPAPNTSRIIEVLVEPILPFELALLADQSLSLGTTGTWSVDSYDSRDASKSAPGGLYPGRDSSMVQSNGNVACNAGRPVNAIYGPLIAANGCQVRGTVATNGGDDPSTPEHENVSGAIQIDKARIRDDFYRAVKPFARPSSGIFLRAPASGGSFVAGTESEPAQYLISRNLNAFSVSSPARGGKGACIIMVDGDIDIPNGAISIQPGVTVTIYARGNIDFHDRPVNEGGLPEALQIFGEETHGEARTLQARGNAKISAAFFGPQYAVKLSDNVEWCGAVAARTFEMIGGGTGGFHYDEALGMVGVPIGFHIARYVEDVRE